MALERALYFGLWSMEGNSYQTAVVCREATFLPSRLTIALGNSFTSLREERQILSPAKPLRVVHGFITTQLDNSAFSLYLLDDWRSGRSLRTNEN